MVPPNCRVKSVERIGGIDRHGNESFKVVLSDFPAYIDRSSTYFRTPNGDAKAIDAILIVPPQFEVYAGDRITMHAKQKEQYRVFNQDESPDAQGFVQQRMFRLVKIVQTS